MLDRLGQPVEVGDYIWYNTRSSYLNLGRVETIVRKPAIAHYYRPNELECTFKIKVQWDNDAPSWLEEHVYFQLGTEPVVRSYHFLKATHEQVGREIVRRTTPTR